MLAALLAAAAAVAAAAFTASATEDVVREHGRQALTLQDNDARGAARVLLSEFLVSENEMTDWVMTGFMRQFGPDFPIDMTKPDLRLIASRVKPADWIWVSAALSTVSELRRYVLDRSRGHNRFTGRLISRRDVFMVARDLRYLGRATRSLDQLAGLGGRSPYRTLNAPAAYAHLQQMSRTYGIPIASD
jgi:hypothetical protein